MHRAEKFGGTVRFTTYKELAEAYAKEEVYPLDLKNAVAAELNKVIASFSDHCSLVAEGVASFPDYCSLIPRPSSIISRPL